MLTTWHSKLLRLNVNYVPPQCPNKTCLANGRIPKAGKFSEELTIHSFKFKYILVKSQSETIEDLREELDDADTDSHEECLEEFMQVQQERQRLARENTMLDYKLGHALKRCRQILPDASI